MQLSGSVTYNGKPFSDFQPLRTANYVEQVDTRLNPEMTVRETLDYSARCQGSGLKKGKSLHCKATHFYMRPFCYIKLKIDCLSSRYIACMQQKGQVKPRQNLGIHNTYMNCTCNLPCATLIASYWMSKIALSSTVVQDDHRLVSWLAYRH